MPVAAHRVRMQRWRVASRSAGEAFALRTRLRAAVEHELAPVFGRAFDAAAPGEALLHIPRLELCLRVPNFDALAGALGEALQRELPLLPPRPPYAAAAGRLSVLLGYLDSGTLAWHAAHADQAAITPELRATLQAELALVAVRRGASFERAMRYYFRLLQLLPLQRWLELAAFIESAAPPTATPARVPSGSSGTGKPQCDLASLLELPEQKWLAIIARMIVAHGLQGVLAPLAAGDLAIARHDVLRLAAALLAAAASPPESRGSATGPEPAAGTAVMKPADRQSEAPLAAPDAPHAAGHRAAPMERRLWHPPRERTLAASAPAPANEAMQVRGEAATAARDARAAEHAAATLMAASVGLVLLHPFLPQLFATCGLVRDGKLRSAAHAAALLHWLATGREEVFEFELGLVKLLLGLRPDAPLAVSEGLLGAREREEGEALLGAALGYWKALGNTTPEGLRVAFLQRRGALREADDGWRLQPESESYDLLLGYLPWGFATVKLPWMTRPLFTDWPTP